MGKLESNKSKRGVTMCKKGGNSSIAENVKVCFEKNKNTTNSWMDLKENMRLKSKITKEVIAENNSIKVEFIDGSNLVIDNPSGPNSAMSVVLTTFGTNIDE